MSPNPRKPAATNPRKRHRIHTPFFSSIHRFSFSLLDSRLPIPESRPPPPPATTIPSRSKATQSGYSPLNDPSPNLSNRQPKETILLGGCDYEHWLIVMEFTSDPKPSDEEMIAEYVKTLAQVVGGEEEAKKRIYSVSTTTYTGFGALISEELNYKVKGDTLVKVLGV